MRTVNARKLTNIATRSKGLIGLNNKTAVYFETHFGIHTFGVNFPIDVILLDKDNRVVVLKKNLKPCRIFFWNPKYYKVVELPESTIENEKISLGEKIKIIFI